MLLFTELICLTMYIKYHNHILLHKFVHIKVRPTVRLVEISFSLLKIQGFSTYKSVRKIHILKFQNF